MLTRDPSVTTGRKAKIFIEMGSAKVQLVLEIVGLKVEGEEKKKDSFFLFSGILPIEWAV